jgi:hypothetical protein
VSIVPPPKPDTVQKPGAATTLGVPKKMTMTEFITTVVAPSTSNTGSGDGGSNGSEGAGAGKNFTHPEKRYMFNTLKNSSLLQDFEVPSLLQQVTTAHEGRFIDCTVLLTDSLYFLCFTMIPGLR